MVITKKYSKEIKQALDPSQLEKTDNLIMVVDMGHSFIKISLFTTYEGSRSYLVSAELKETEKIISNGEINFNLLSRYVTRKAQELNDFGRISRLIVIPPRVHTNAMQIHKLEYQEKYNDFKKQVTTSYKDIFSDSSNIDWGVITNHPEQDYRNVIIDSLKDEHAIAFGNAFVNVPVDSVTVTSPAMSYLGLNKEGPYMVIDIGHISTTVVIVDDGIIYLRNISVGGGSLTDALVEKDPNLEDMKFKHSLTVEELPPTTDIMFNNIVSEIEEATEFYKQVSLKELKEYCILGGTGNLLLEEVINDLRTGLKRFYPKLDLENANQIPTETVQYFLPSVMVFNYMLHNGNDKERRIDFTASKGNALRFRIKQVADWFRKNKLMTMGVVASTYLVFGALSLTAYNTNMYHAEISQLQTSAQSEHDSASSSLATAQSELTALLANDVNDFNYDTGKLLDRVKNITPPNLNMRQFNLNSVDDTGTIVVASPNQVITATLVTLLQDGEGAPFQKADIIEIKKETNSLEEVYITTIYVEGRNL